VTTDRVEEQSAARAESRRFVLLCGLASAIITVALVVFRPDSVTTSTMGLRPAAPLDSGEAPGRPSPSSNTLPRLQAYEALVLE
jgi:hypothetical protein